jgi:hypothetical protein
MRSRRNQRTTAATGTPKGKVVDDRQAEDEAIKLRAIVAGHRNPIRATEQLLIISHW